MILSWDRNLLIKYILFLSWSAGFSKEVKTVSLSTALLPLDSSDGLNSEKLVLLVQKSSNIFRNQSNIYGVLAFSIEALASTFLTVDYLHNKAPS